MIKSLALSALVAAAAMLVQTADALGATTVSVVAEVPNASEQGPSPGIFRLQRVGDISAALTVIFTLGGSATRNTDYLIWETSARFEAGSDTAYVTVLPVNDAVNEGPETISLTLSPSTAYAVTSPSSATVTVANAYLAGFPGVFDWRESQVGLRKDITYLQTLIASGHLWIWVGVNDLLATNVQIWLDTDQNPATGDFRHGFIGGAEYRVWAAATTGFFADYSLIRLPKNKAECAPDCERTILNVQPVQIVNGGILQIAVPLAAIGNPTGVDVFASTALGATASQVPGNGDRAPQFGALSTSTGKVVVRKPGKTLIRSFSDAAGDAPGIGYDLMSLRVDSVADQMVFALRFSRPFDPSYPQFGPGPRGELLLDSDRQLLTGEVYMGAQIPTWGGDGRLFFDFTTFVPLVQYSFDPTGANVIFADQHNDGRWLVQGDTLWMAASRSVFDAFAKSAAGSTRKPTDGRPIVSVKSLEVNTSLLDARTVDEMPGKGSAFSTLSGKALSPLSWVPGLTVAASDPLEYGPISGMDLTRVDAEISSQKLVVKGVLASWLNTDTDNVFQVLLDTDMNSATGLRWFSNNGGQTIGADYRIEIVSIDGVTPFYIVHLIGPSGAKTIHDAIVLPRPAASAARPGSFTVTLPLAALGSLGNRLQLYVLTGRNRAQLGDDTAPVQPLCIELATSKPCS